MTALFLKLLNINIEKTGKITSARLDFYPEVNIAFLVLLTVLIGISVYFLYKSPADDVPVWKRNTMAGLRIAFLIMLLFIFLKPTIALTLEGSIRRTLLFLLDNTASMQIKDFRSDAMDIRRAAIAKGIIKSPDELNHTIDHLTTKSMEQIPRIELVKSSLTNQNVNLIKKLENQYDLTFFLFGRTTKEIIISTNSVQNTTNNADLFNEFDGHEKQTAIGDSIRDLLNKKRGIPLAGIFIATDGANNSGSSPIDIAAIARDEGVPLYIYGVGITYPKDIIMISLFAPEVAFAKEESTATIRIKSQGMIGKSSSLKLYLNDNLADEKLVNFQSDGETTLTMKFTPQEKGNYDLKAIIDPLKEEIVKDNNLLNRQIKIIDQKINVLLVEQYPRWEYRYLLAKLMGDRRINLKSILLEADPEVTKFEGSVFIPNYPISKEELFKFDLIIIGDVDSKNFTTEQIDNTALLVSQFGGGLIMIAGKKFNPWSYRKTTLEKLLPVEFETVPVDLVGESFFEKQINIELTSSGKQNLMLRLGDTDDSNLKIWRNLPPIYWDARVSRAKPAADVLLVDVDESKESRFGKMPVIAIQQYGVGQVLFVGTDNTWRWRKNTGESYHSALWIQIAQRMALPKLLGGSKRVQLSSDKQNYLIGEKVNVLARLYTPSFEPLTLPFVKSAYSLRTSGQSQAEETEITLRLVQDQPGVYQGEFIAPAIGQYHFYIQNEKDTAMDFNVIEPLFEFGETAMNSELLQNIAKISGGVYVREEDLYKLPEIIQSKAQKIESRIEAPLWSSPLYFIILLSIVTAEWIMRKKSQLK